MRYSPPSPSWPGVGLKRLVYFEERAAIGTAIQREQTMKHWKRAWKVQLILHSNPGWADLYNLFLDAAPRGWPGQARP